MHPAQVTSDAAAPPQAAYSIYLLDELENLGFQDEHFLPLHHFSVKEGRNDDTIDKHREYLVSRGVGTVRAANLRVQQRLKCVLDVLHTSPASDFSLLVKDALDRFPFLPSDYERGGGKYGEDSND